MYEPFVKPILAVAEGESEIFITGYSAVSNKDGKITVKVNNETITIFDSDEETADAVFHGIVEDYFDPNYDVISILRILTCDKHEMPF